MDWLYFIIIIILLVAIFALVKYIDSLNEEIETKEKLIIKLSEKNKNTTKNKTKKEETKNKKDN